ncbi:MAG: MerR family transcriptional regulator [Solirubrobacteraceae bacterium]
MTVGQFSRRTGMSPKVIRELEGRGLIRTAGRSDGNYRLFNENSLQCARTIAELRRLGFTLTQIEQLYGRCRAGSGQPVEVQFNQTLEDVRSRLTAQVADLQEKISRIDAMRGVAPDRLGTASWLEDPCLSS